MIEQAAPLMALSWLLWVGLGVAAVAGFLVFQRTKAQAKALENKTSSKEQLLLEDQRRILDLQKGDIIEHYLDSYVIEAVLLYDEEGFVWKNYLLTGAEESSDKWLSVEDDDTLVIGLYEKLPPGTVEVPAEAPRQLQVGDVTFTREETGSARVRKRDDKGTRDMGNCRYAQYQEPGGGRLSVEWFGEDPEVSLGKIVAEDELLILPGS